MAMKRYNYYTSRKTTAHHCHCLECRLLAFKNEPIPKYDHHTDCPFSYYLQLRKWLDDPNGRNAEMAIAYGKRAEEAAKALNDRLGDCFSRGERPPRNLPTDTDKPAVPPIAPPPATKGRVGELEDRIAELEDEVDELDTTCLEMGLEIAELRDENAMLKKTIAELQATTAATTDTTDDELAQAIDSNLTITDHS